jgi:hypothetical protein
VGKEGPSCAFAQVGGTIWSCVNARASVAVAIFSTPSGCVPNIGLAGLRAGTACICENRARKRKVADVENPALRVHWLGKRRAVWCTQVLRMSCTHAAPHAGPVRSPGYTVTTPSVLGVPRNLSAIFSFTSIFQRITQKIKCVNMFHEQNWKWKKNLFFHSSKMEEKSFLP